MSDLVGNPEDRFSRVAAHWIEMFDLSHVMRKPTFCICLNKGADQLRTTAKLISTFVFATSIVQFLFYLYPKFQASSLLIRLYRPVCVGHDRKRKLLEFSCKSSFVKFNASVKWTTLKVLTR